MNELTIPMTGNLDQRDVRTLLSLAAPLHLATMDQAGFPRITPIWFLWDGGCFYMTSVEGRRHLADIARNPRVSVCIDTEEGVSVDGVRHNRQVKARGEALLQPDDGGYWTRRISKKCVAGAEGEALAERRASMPRVLINLCPKRLICLGTRG